MRKPKSAKGGNKQTRPDWLTVTPLATYQLLGIMADGSCSGNASSQSIPMTVEEYEALKRELAKMRGYKIPKAAA